MIMITRKDIILDSNPLLRQKSVDVQLPLSKEDEALRNQKQVHLLPGYDPERLYAEAGSSGDQGNNPAAEEPDEQRESDR